MGDREQTQVEKGEGDEKDGGGNVVCCHKYEIVKLHIFNNLQSELFVCT